MKLIIPAAFACLLSHELDGQGWAAYKPQIAAQIQIESAWRPEARSRYAAGLAQFTPPTWSDWAPRVEPSCEGLPATDAACSIRAQIAYMAYLRRREKGSWHNAWRAYNGGPGWLDRERRAASAAGLDPRAEHDLELVCRAAGRSEASCRENIAYPRKIKRLL